MSSIQTPRSVIQAGIGSPPPASSLSRGLGGERCRQDIGGRPFKVGKRGKRARGCGRTRTDLGRAGLHRHRKSKDKRDVHKGTFSGTSHEDWPWSASLLFFYAKRLCSWFFEIHVGQMPVRKNMTRECLLGGGGRGRSSPLHRLPGFKTAVLVFRWQSHCRPRPGGSVPTNRHRLCVSVPPAIKKGKELLSPKRDDNRRRQQQQQQRVGQRRQPHFNRYPLRLFFSLGPFVLFLDEISPSVDITADGPVQRDDEKGLLQRAAGRHGSLWHHRRRVRSQGARRGRPDQSHA